MNQNIDNDLQKAIDDITKTTAGDPIFADPVATPEAPAPAPMAAEPMPAAPVAPAPEPSVSAEMPSQPKIVDPMIAGVSNPAGAPAFTAPAPMPTGMPTPPPMPTPVPVAPKAPVAPAMPESPAPQETVPAGSNKIEEEIVTVAPFMDEKEGSLSVKQVKEAALRGLAPILSKMDVPAEQKFDIYKNVTDNYHDSSVLEPAYRAASEISDDKERGEALLYLVDSIDDMNS